MEGKLSLGHHALLDLGGLNFLTEFNGFNVDDFEQCLALRDFLNYKGWRLKATTTD